MIGLGVGLTSGSGGLLQETRAVLSAMTTAPSGVRAGQINTLIGALIAAGVWAKLGHLYVLHAHDAQAARINWIAPGTGDLSEVNSPTFTANAGYTGNGTTSYLTAGIAIRAPYALNSAHLGVWVNDNQAGSFGVIGVAAAATATARLNVRTAGNVVSGRINSTSNTIVGGVTDSSGHTVVNRTGASATAIFKNGASLMTGSEASTAVPTDHLTVLRSDTIYSPHTVSLAHAGSGLTVGEADAIYDAFGVFRS